MSIPFWQRPWLDGAKEHYEEDFDPEDLDEFEEEPEEPPRLPDIQPDEHLMGEYDEANGDVEPF